MQNQINCLSKIRLIVFKFSLVIQMKCRPRFSLSQISYITELFANFPSSEGCSIRCLESGFEQVEENLPLPQVNKVLQNLKVFKGTMILILQNHPLLPFNQEVLKPFYNLRHPPPKMSGGSMHGGWKVKILSMDRFHFFGHAYYQSLGKH